MTIREMKEYAENKYTKINFLIGYNMHREIIVRYCINSISSREKLFSPESIPAEKFARNV